MLLPWALYYALGSATSVWLADRCGSRIEEFASGRIVDIPRFIELRLRDGIILTTALFLLVVVGRVLFRFVERRLSHHCLWGALAAYAFVAGNAFLVVAGETALYWGLLYAANPNLKQSAFHLERNLLAESQAEMRAVVVGSSQGGSEIDTGRLNRCFYPNCQFVKLTCAGAQGFDLLLVQQYYLGLKPKLVLCYLSELNLYTPAGDGRFIPFLGPQGVIDLHVLDPEGRIETARLPLGVLAMSLPAFRQRRALELAIFGGEAGDARAGHKAVAGADRESFDQFAERSARGYQISHEAEFQKQALELFLSRNSELGITTVVILGQVNPVLERHIDQVVKSDFREYVRSLNDKFGPSVVVLDDVPRHRVEDYYANDLMHVKHSARKEFTGAIQKRLEAIVTRPAGYKEALTSAY